MKSEQEIREALETLTEMFNYREQGFQVVSYQTLEALEWVLGKNDRMLLPVDKINEWKARKKRNNNKKDETIEKHLKHLKG